MESARILKTLASCSEGGRCLFFEARSSFIAYCADASFTSVARTTRPKTAVETATGCKQGVSKEYYHKLQTLVSPDHDISQELEVPCREGK